MEEASMHASRRKASALKRSAQALLLAVLVAASNARPAISADFVLVNRSGEVLDQFYISPCAGRHWGANQLSGAPLLSTRSFTISELEPGCYDVMVVLPPWNECIVAGLAVRRTTAWTISWSTRLQSSFGDCSSTAGIPSAGRRPWIPNDR
jgi:hypothetical protein